MLIPNIPYTPRAPLEDDRIFANYTTMIKEIEQDLVIPGTAFALVGGPGMAKSSILKKIQRDLMAKISGSARPNPITLFPSYIKLIPPDPNDSRKIRTLFSHIVTELLKDVGNRIDPDVSEADLFLHRPPLERGINTDLSDLKRDLWTVVRELERKFGPSKLVLLIDDVARLIGDKPIRVSFARALKELVSSGGTSGAKDMRAYLAMVLACDRDISDILPTEDGTALGADILPKYLSVLSGKDSVRLIQEPLREANIELPPGITEAVYMQTGGHPRLLHHLMYAVCMNADPELISTNWIHEQASSVAAQEHDIANSVQSYVDENPLAKVILLHVYGRGVSLSLDQIAAGIPGYPRFRISDTLQALESLGAVTENYQGFIKVYRATGKIFQQWFEQSRAVFPGGLHVTVEPRCRTILTSVQKPEDHILVCNVYNPSPFSRIVRLEYSIDGFSQTWHDEVVLSPEEKQSREFRPIFKPEEIAKIETIRDSVLRAKIYYMDQSGYEVEFSRQDHVVRLLPRDVWVIAKTRHDGTIIDLSSDIAAWVTPRAPAVERMLRKAAEYNSLGKGIWGYQGGSNPKTQRQIVHAQINAFYDALKKNGHLTYIESSLSFGQHDDVVQQRVRLPSQTLHLRGAANCIDGSVLFASLIEACGMNPAIVIVPGHAFVAWETWEDSGDYECLETTMVRKHTFRESVAVGNRQFNQALKNGYFDRKLFDRRGFARLLKIKELRQSGILPMECT